MTAQKLQALADGIPAAMLQLTTRLVIADVMAVYHVTHITAESIVEVARLRHGHH
jgi:hypothetical protein